MKAVVYDVAGGPDVLRYEDVADPVCGPNDVVIEVRAVAIEGGDLINRANAPVASPSHVPGYAAAGIIVQVGSGVHDIQPGTPVTTWGMAGSHATLRSVSGEERARRLRALGVDCTIDYRAHNVVDAVRAFTKGAGADLVIDPVGTTITDSLRILKQHGRWCSSATREAIPRKLTCRPRWKITCSCAVFSWSPSSRRQPCAHV